MKKKNTIQKKPYRASECYAKLVLEKLFPDRFFQLEIIDKPDLQNKTESIGVEVTSAVPKRVKENDGLFSRLTFRKGTPEQRERCKKRVRAMGGVYFDEGYMISWSGTRDTQEIYSAFEKKLTKLNNDGYISLAKQYVFIADENVLNLDDYSAIQSELIRRQESTLINFDSVFLNLDRCLLIEFNMKTGEFQKYRIDDFETLLDKAYHMANGD